MNTQETKFTISQISSANDFCNEYLSNDELIELLENLETESDFEISGYRFISESEIDSIQLEELSSDEYILGCFNDWFISDNCDIDYEIVQALQKAEAFSELGKLMLSKGIEDLQEEYARIDGYGHHFAYYDHETIEDLISDFGFYVFRID